MAKILYGVCGEGLGHASRSKILISHLQKNHTVKIVAGGKAFPYLSKEFDDVIEIESPHFVYKDDEVKMWLTIFRMIFITFLKASFSLVNVRKMLKEFQPDLLITDAEPISFFASRTHGIKRVSIDNPQALLHKKYYIPSGEYFAWLTLCIAVKLTIFNADNYLIYDFSDEQPKNPAVRFVKPLIQEGIRLQKPKDGGHIFVYQSLGSATRLAPILKTIDESFIIYGCNIDKVDENLIFRSFNNDTFYRDIAHAKAVITNGGFTVLSEALYLKKPVFCLPIKHQFEQVMNGQFIEELGAGVSSMNFCREDVLDFLSRLSLYKKNLASYNPGDQKQILHCIEEQLELIS